jgi:hypothetical protein
MALIAPAFPPGIYRAGTAYQSKGRWYDSNLVRFYEGTIQPKGGWRSKTSDTVTGSARAILSWHDNSARTWTAIGTHSNLYAMSRSGTVSDITPSGFTTGRTDAVVSGGYGGGNYGVGTYGTPRPDSDEIQAASMWSLDNFGENLVGVMADDGIIYQWELNTGTAAAAVSNAPSAAALLVTQEGMLMALGAANVPRRVQWSDQRDNTVWTPDATNQAGDFDLQTNGVLLQGVRLKGGHLLFTDIDAWYCAATGDQLVYSFTKAGDGCGAISRNCAISLDTQAVWMGRSGFWLYNGYVTPLPCDVWDYVYGDINLQQVSKITVEVNTTFGEVTWRYPSGSSIEINRSVTWNWRENHWTIDNANRLCGFDRGVTQYPIRVDSSGNIYEHEVGYIYTGSDMPYLESGPAELGNGDNVLRLLAMYADNDAVGDVSLTIKSSFYPDDSETSDGPHTITSKTDLRTTGRQIRIRFDGVNNTAWRIGQPRFDVVSGGRR